MSDDVAALLDAASREGARADATCATAFSGRVALAALPIAIAHVDALRSVERACLHPRAIDKRRAEFASGRAAGRAALRALLERRDVAIVRDASDANRGVPRVVDTGGAPVDVDLSITHHEGLAVAAAARSPVGVDLVFVEPHGESFRHDAFVAGEVAAWARALSTADTSDLAVCAAFAAKECASKILELGFGLPLLGFSVEPRATERGLGVKVVHPAGRFACDALIARRGSRLLVILLRDEQR